ncbi:MAG TPA: SapC family protein [Sphingomonas sp.]|nr:SapC family protein [Sphingomonas sp.]
MSGPVLLNNIDHADVRVRLGYGPAFGDAVNQIDLFPTEFEAAQRDYPIVFRRNPDGGYRAVALLGLDRDENLFLDRGEWRARYVPALIQRGPFSIGVPRDGGEPMIHIDLGHPRISRNEGEPLFREHGGNAPYLDHIAKVLQLIYAGVDAAAPMFAAFDALDLIEPVTIDIELTDTRRYRVPNCHTIDRARLAQLDGEALAELHRNDFLRAAMWVSSSLGNVSRLIELKLAAERDG